MAVGNLEAIRDWMIGNPTEHVEENWYNIEQINDILACGAVHLYNKRSQYYCDNKDVRVNYISSFQFYKNNNIPCYSGGYHFYNGRADCAAPVFISKEEHGVDYRVWNGVSWQGLVTVKGSFVINGITWYYSGEDFNSSYANCERNVGTFSTLEAAAQKLFEVCGHGDLL